MRLFERCRTPLWIVGYAIYLYLSGLSLRKDSKTISIFLPRSHQSILMFFEVWKTYYNHVRYYMSLGKPPCRYRVLEPYTMISIIEEVMRKA